MTEEAYYCPQCEVVEMELIDRLKDGKTFECRYRRRRFACPVCNHSEIIYADGAKDGALTYKKK